MSSETPKRIEQIYESVKPLLFKLSVRGFQRYHDTNKFCVVCIDVDDPYWKPFLKTLMPNQEESVWENIRQSGLTPIATGVFKVDLIKDVLTQKVSGLKNSFSQELDPTQARAAILASAWAAVYQLNGVPRPSTN